MASTTELILRFTGDPRHLKQTLAQVRAELSQFSQGQVVATQGVARQAQQSEQRRVADTIRAANQRLREEQRAANEVARIVRQTARQAEASLLQVGLSEKQQVAAAQSLQRQRSSGLISLWKQEEREAARSAQNRTQEERRQISAAIALQRQRSSALVAQFKQEEREALRAAQTRLREESRALRQKIAEENRVAREVARITAETARQAIAQERLRERAAKTLADVQIREARRAALELQRSIRQQQQSSATPTTGGSFLAGAVGGLTAVIGLNVANEIRQAGAAWLDYSSKLETTRIAFTTMLGSAQAADAHLKELQRFALTTPFQFGELIDASQRMQALGFNAQQVVPILNDVGNAVAAAGGGSERLDRVVLAISQIQSKGKVATQELNQLAEAGISGFKILEQALGKSRAELVEMVEKGQISSKIFLDAFQKFSQQNFGGLMEKQSRTFTGAMSNIKDALLQTSATAFEPLFKKISEITDRIAQELQKGQPTLESVTRSITQGLIEIIATAGAQAGTAFIESTARKIGDVSAWKQLLRNISGTSILEPAFRGLFSIDPEDLFGIGDVEIPQINLPDLSVPLRSQATAQNEVSESAKKAGDIVRDLILRLAFYGQTTERAATLQKLLAIGTDAVTSAEGKRALQLSTLIDKQRLAIEASEAQRKLTADLAAITEGKYKNAFNSLTQAIQDSTLSVLELNAAEQGGLSPLEKFNFGLGAQVEGMLSVAQASGFSAEQIALLRTAVSNARTAMVALTQAQIDNEKRSKRKEAIETLNQFIRQQAETLRQLRFGDKAALQEAEEFIALFPKWTGAMLETQTFSDAFWLRFNAHLIDSAKRMRTMIDLMREMADAVPSAATIPVPEFDTQRVFDADVLGAPPPPDFSLWKAAISDIKADMVSFGEVAQGAIAGSITGIAGALVHGVEAWALYGQSIGKAMQQGLAAVAAKIAGEALFQGALHAAYAIGSLAFLDFRAAAQHGIAAAKFFAVAAAAGLGARAIAGNSFQQGSGGSGRGGSTGSASRSGDRNRERDPIDLVRQQRQEVHVFFHTEPGGGFRDEVVRTVIDDVKRNGPMRTTITETAGG